MQSNLAWRHARGPRRIAVLGAVALIASLSSVVVRVAPAMADHDGHALQVAPDVIRTRACDKTTDATCADTLVNVMLDAYASPPSGSDGSVTVQWEFVGGPLEIDSGYTPWTPDGACTITLSLTAPSPNPACSPQPRFSSVTPGTSSIYFWVDESDSADNAEVDKNEGRLAGIATDCPFATVAGTETSAANGTCQQGTAKPGTTAEPDDTDVIEVTFFPAPALLDCAPAPQGGAPDVGTVKEDTAAAVDCLVTTEESAGKLPIPNVVIDGENFADLDPPTAWTNDGANDPDQGAPSGPVSTVPGQAPAYPPENPDYNDACVTDASGHCRVTIPASRAQVGSAVTCFWIDGIQGAVPNASNSNGDDVTDNTFQRPGTGTKIETDGARCLDEQVDDTFNVGCNPTCQVNLKAANKTDLVLVAWEPPLMLKGGIDLQPEAQTLRVGDTASITAMAYDQFGGPMPDIHIAFAFYRGSPSFPKFENDEAHPDLTCVTDAEGICSVSFASRAKGTDLICAWTDHPEGEPAQKRTPPDLSGNSANGTCSTGSPEGLADTTADDGPPSPQDDAIDVAKVVWTVPPPPEVPPPPPPPQPRGAGYWLIASDGGVFSFGGAGFHGSTGDMVLTRPIVGGEPTRSADGYWLVAADGGVFAFGDAGFFGSTGNMRLNKPIIDMATTPSGKGYWLLAADGGIFAFGDAAFAGSTGAMQLNQPIVSMAATPTGKGYWLLAADGGIFAFGDAAYYGSAAELSFGTPIVAMAATPSGEGYWLTGADGAMFTFGDASYYGSPAEGPLNRAIISMVASPTGDGYWMVGSDGGVFAYGDATFMGSTGGLTLNQPILGMLLAVELT